MLKMKILIYIASDFFKDFIKHIYSAYFLFLFLKTAGKYIYIILILKNIYQKQKQKTILKRANVEDEDTHIIASDFLKIL
jgi:hypothetical protein